MKLSEKLIRLKEAWNYEVADLNRLKPKFFTLVKNLSNLNTEIYNECIKEGIDIKDLKLNE